MSLDKQKILNELGNVVTQLQSAECGCMNNVFENQNGKTNMSSNMMQNVPNAGCGHLANCYCHSHHAQGCNPSNYCNSNHGNCYGHHNPNMNRVCAGDTCMFPNNANQNVPCSNPVNLYSDTYNYLNKNLVQPTIEDVYNELKTITPENTIMNNPIAKQMGLPFPNQPQIPNQMSGDAKHSHFPKVNGYNGPLGTGPNIVNMMSTDNTKLNIKSDVDGQNLSMHTTNDSDVKLQPQSNSFNPLLQTAQVRQVLGNTKLTPSIGNSQMLGHNHYQNPQSPIVKFNQMFPEIKNKFGDLGYDPMAIAMQMKDESIKQGAKENMQKIAQNENVTETQNNAQLLKNNYFNLNNIMPDQQQITNINENNQRTGQMQNIQNSDDANIRQKRHQHVETRNDNQSNTYYNTLGQPIEILPAEIYRLPRDTLPQTLSPQPIPMGEIVKRNQINVSNFGNVKSTVSKTSLTGKNLSGNHSKTQLQHLYNQYRGSQSFTNQNIQSPIQKSTISEGKIFDNISHIAPNNVLPIENAAGDTLMNNGNAMISNNIATEKPTSAVPVPDNKIISRTGRNGLQDVKFTSYPSTTSWSFHGGYSRPISTKYYGGR